MTTTRVASIQCLCLSLVAATVLKAQGPWRLTERQQAYINHTVGAFATGDLDGNGYPDIVGTGGFNSQIIAYRIDNLGPLGYAPLAPIVVGPPASYREMKVVDIDRDGDLDILLLRGDTGAGNGDPNYRNSLLINDGRGNFTDQTTQRWPTGAWSTMDAAVHDFNGDGLLDIVEVNYGVTTPHRLYFGQPNGTFVDVTATHLPFYEHGWQVAIGDLDGNGSPDIVIAKGQIGMQGDLLFLNDGTGRFSDHSYRLSSRRNDSGVAIGDIDGDGDLDLVFAVSSWPSEPVDQRCCTALLNDGQGNFTQNLAAFPPSGFSPWFCDFQNGAQLVDIDQDGDLDAVFDGMWYRHLFLNDGNGLFQEPPAAMVQVPSCYNARHFTIADMDRDGDLDQVCSPTGCGGFDVNIIHSLSRHLIAPAAPRLGQPYSVTINGQPGGTAILGLSTGTTLLPLGNHGNLQLDPGSLTLWPSLASLDPQGVGTLNLPLPNDLSLVGFRVFLQAFTHSRPTNSLVFTNAFAETIQR